MIDRRKNKSRLISELNELRQRNREIEKAADQFRCFLDSASDFILILNDQLTISEVNKTFCEKFQFNKSDIVNQPLSEILPELRDTYIRDQLIQVSQTGETCYFDHIVIEAGTGIVHVSVRVFKVGEGLGLIATDITEQKLSEDVLIRERKSFRIIAEAATLASDIPDLCRIVLQGLMETLDFSTGSLRLYEGKSQTLYPVAVVGLEPHLIPENSCIIPRRFFR